MQPEYLPVGYSWSDEDTDVERWRGEDLPGSSKKNKDKFYALYQKTSSRRDYLNKDVCLKLEEDFNRTHNYRNHEKANEQMNTKMLNMLLRYQGIMGDTGQHGQLPRTVFNVLKSDFNCTCECFASPLNHYYEDYCSPFADTDAAFGSLGSFFDLEADHGCFEVNPPFYIRDDIVERHMLELLKRGQGLCFIVIFPTPHFDGLRYVPALMCPVPPCTLPSFLSHHLWF